jgi:hypothetical protein
MTASKDTADGMVTCLCPCCGRMACGHRPERDTAPVALRVLAEILHLTGGRQAGREAGS